jgi:tRNA (mo5U34)-methyltransferase
MRENERHPGAPIEDQDLETINGLLPWYAAAPLPDGRLLGKLGTRAGKRADPGRIPDKRIVRLNEVLPLRSRRVIEVGCFEGIHTVGLLQFCDDVTAIDVRAINVVKTATRVALSGYRARVALQDVEKLDASARRYDLMFHCGVLYHLMHPAEQIVAAGQVADHIFLDTHIARHEPRLEERRIGSIAYKGAHHGEGGWADPFSGRDATAFWLTLDSLQDLLRHAGFERQDVWQLREERNGPRVSLFASRA